MQTCPYESEVFHKVFNPLNDVFDNKNMRFSGIIVLRSCLLVGACVVGRPDYETKEKREKRPSGILAFAHLGNLLFQAAHYQEVWMYVHQIYLILVCLRSCPIVNIFLTHNDKS